MHEGFLESFIAAAWTGSAFIVGGPSGLTLESADGLSWEASSTGASGALLSPAWAGDRWLALSDDGTLYSSTDGLHWSFGVVGSLGKPSTRYLVASDSVVLAAGEKLLRSLDREHFVEVPNVGQVPRDSIVWTGQEFLAGGSISSGGPASFGGVLASSRDGLTWRVGGLDGWLARIGSLVPTSVGVLAGFFPGGILRSGCDGDASVIPTAAHISGANGTLWRTDVAVANVGATRQSFSLELLARDRDNSTPASRSFTLDPGLAAGYPDLLGTVFKQTGVGAVRVRGNARIAVTSRTYNETRAGTFGQHVPAFVDSEAISAKRIMEFPRLGRGGIRGLTRAATIPQLSQSAGDSAGFCTNLGVVNVGAAPIEVVISLHGADAALIGAMTVSLRGYEMRQIDAIFKRFTSADVESGYALVHTATSDGRFFAYASVVDNRTGDPIFIPAQ